MLLNKIHAIILTGTIKNICGGYKNDPVTKKTYSRNMHYCRRRHKRCGDPMAAGGERPGRHVRFLHAERHGSRRRARIYPGARHRKKYSDVRRCHLLFRYEKRYIQIRYSHRRGERSMHRSAVPSPRLQRFVPDRQLSARHVFPRLPRHHSVQRGNTERKVRQGDTASLPL